MKQIIIPTGYMSSGSSAITDILSEIDGISNVSGTQEYIFLHCPNGIFELENRLLNQSSCLSSKSALIDFRAMMEKLYDLQGWWPSYYKTSVSKNFMKYTDEYISKLIDLKFNGFWYMDEFPEKRTFVKRVRNYYNRKFLKINRMDNIKMTLSYPTKEKFYKESKEYIYKIINAINKNNLPNIVIDQLLVPQNLYRMKNYFDNDAKVIVVERDPRDVYISNKYFGKECNVGVPYPTDVYQFCEMYKKIRENEIIEESKNILRIKFEDLVYNYEDTLKKIYKFVDVKQENHINKFQKFNPNKSIDNTQLFINKIYEKESKIIEAKLTNYLYKFPYSYNKNERNIF